MSAPLNPPSVTRTAQGDLPAYVSNGLIGLRVLDIPLLPGIVLYGLPGIRVGPGEPQEWAVRRVVLPAGWRSIEIERAWIRRRPARIVAEHGAERAIIGSRVARRRRLRVA